MMTRIPGGLRGLCSLRNLCGIAAAEHRVPGGIRDRGRSRYGPTHDPDRGMVLHMVQYRGSRTVPVAGMGAVPICPQRMSRYDRAMAPMLVVPEIGWLKSLGWIWILSSPQPLISRATNLVTGRVALFTGFVTIPR